MSNGQRRHFHWRRAAIALAATALLSLPADAGSTFDLLVLDGSHVKWGTAALGTGAKVRYAFVAKPETFPGARNCGSMLPLDELLARSRVDTDALKKEAAAAFAMWERAANISFEETDNSQAADILIGAQAIPRGRAFANVAYEPEATSPVRKIAQSLICLNPKRPWKVGFGGDAKAYDLRYAIAHEIGHAIGLDHAGPHGQLMSFNYSEAFRGLQAGDMSGAVALYGSRGAGPPTRAASERRPGASELGLR